MGVRQAVTAVACLVLFAECLEPSSPSCWGRALGTASSPPSPQQLSASLLCYLVWFLPPGQVPPCRAEARSPAFQPPEKVTLQQAQLPTPPTTIAWLSNASPLTLQCLPTDGAWGLKEKEVVKMKS